MQMKWLKPCKSSSVGAVWSPAWAPFRAEALITQLLAAVAAAGSWLTCPLGSFLTQAHPLSPVEASLPLFFLLTGLPCFFYILGMGMDSKKLGEVLGKWNRKTETRKLNKAKQIKQLSQLVNRKTLSSLTLSLESKWFTPLLPNQRICSLNHPGQGDKGQRPN